MLYVKQPGETMGTLKKNLNKARHQVALANQNLEIDRQFGMLGFILTADKKALADAKNRLKKARTAFYIG